MELTDSVTVYDMAKKAAYLFERIGRDNESRYAAGLAEELREAIRKNLINTDTMTAAGSCQTSQAFTLAAGIFNADERKAAERVMIDMIHRDGDINACGMIGLRHIFHVLTAAGESELAYKLITDKSRTGYGYWIENGATALWEDFREKDDPCPDSKNHHFLGDISSWFIQELAGLKSNPNLDDIRCFEFSPHFIAEIDYAKAKYASRFGRVEISWQRNGVKIKLDIFMPDGTYGTVVLPKGTYFEDGNSVVELCAGEHSFIVG